MSASARCPHTVVRWNVQLVDFEDTNVRYLEVTGECVACEAPARFAGMPFGLSPTEPTMAVDGSQATLPVMFGEEEYDGKAMGFVGRQVQ